jgi:hypothetical protein
MPELVAHTPQSRHWRTAGGVEYELWLDLLGQGIRPILTFVDLRNPERQLVRRVPVGTLLVEMTDAELEELLEGPTDQM